MDIHTKSRLFESLTLIADSLVKFLLVIVATFLLLLVLYQLDRRLSEWLRSRKALRTGQKAKSASGFSRRCRVGGFSDARRRINLTTAMDGCRVLLEIRWGRRSHGRVLARGRITEGEDPAHAIAVTLEVPNRCRIGQRPPIPVRVPDKQLRDFEIVPGYPDLFRLSSVLYIGDAQCEDTMGWCRPPIIISKSDLDLVDASSG